MKGQSGLFTDMKKEWQMVNVHQKSTSLDTALQYCV